MLRTCRWAEHAWAVGGLLLSYHLNNGSQASYNRLHKRRGDTVCIQPLRTLQWEHRTHWTRYIHTLIGVRHTHSHAVCCRLPWGHKLYLLPLVEQLLPGRLGSWRLDTDAAKSFQRQLFNSNLLRTVVVRLVATCERRGRGLESPPFPTSRCVWQRLSRATATLCFFS